ncbi:hypothetical protein HN51_066742 [Arachis hypogaea]
MTVDLVVASPVEDYFLYIDDLKNPDNPNAKAFKRDEDRDGQVTIIAVRPIRKEEKNGFDSLGCDALPLIGDLIQAKSTKGFSGDYVASHFELVALASESSANIRTITSFCHEEHVIMSNLTFFPAYIIITVHLEIVLKMARLIKDGSSREQKSSAEPVSKAPSKIFNCFEKDFYGDGISLKQMRPCLG